MSEQPFGGPVTTAPRQRRTPRLTVRESVTGAPIDPIQDPGPPELSAQLKLLRGLALGLVLLVLGVIPAVLLASPDAKSLLYIRTGFLVKGGVLIAWLIVSLLLAIGVSSWIHVLPKHKRYVTINVLGYEKIKGPRVFFVFAPLQQIYKEVTVRLLELDIVDNFTTTADDFPVALDATLGFYVEDPLAAVFNIENFMETILDIAENTVVELGGQKEYDFLKREKAQISVELKATIEQELKRLAEENKNPGIRIGFFRFSDVSIVDQRLRELIASLKGEEIRAEGKDIQKEKEGEYVEAIAKSLRRQFPKASDTLLAQLVVQRLGQEALEHFEGSAILNLLGQPITTEGVQIADTPSRRTGQSDESGEENRG